MRIGNYAGGMDIVLTGPEHKALGFERAEVKVDMRGLGSAKEWVTVTGTADGTYGIMRRKDGIPYIRYRFPKGGAHPKTFAIEEVESTLTDGVLYGAKPKMANAPIASKHEVITGFKKPAAERPAAGSAVNGKVVEALDRGVKYLNAFMRENPDRAKLWVDDEGVLHMSLTYTYEFGA